MRQPPTNGGRCSWAGSLRLAATIAAAAFLAAGCIDFEMQFTVHDDGSGSAEVSVYFSETTLLAFSALSDAAPDELCSELLEEAEMEEELESVSEGLDWETETHTSAEACGVTLSTEWAAEDFEAARQEFADDGNWSLMRLDDGGWRFEMDMSEFEDGLGEGAATDDAEMFGDFGFAQPTLTVSVNLPGDPVEDNATTRSGSEFGWEIDLADASASGFPDVLFAQTVPAPSTVTDTIVGFVVIVMAGAFVVMLVMLIRRRRRGARSAAPQVVPVSAPASAPDAADTASVPDSGEAPDAIGPVDEGEGSDETDRHEHADESPDRPTGG